MSHFYACVQYFLNSVLNKSAIWHFHKEKVLVTVWNCKHREGSFAALLLSIMRGNLRLLPAWTLQLCWEHFAHICRSWNIIYLSIHLSIYLCIYISINLLILDVWRYLLPCTLRPVWLMEQSKECSLLNGDHCIVCCAASSTISGTRTHHTTVVKCIVYSV